MTLGLEDEPEPDETLGAALSLVGTLTLRLGEKLAIALLAAPPHPARPPPTARIATKRTRPLIKRRISDPSARPFSRAATGRPIAVMILCTANRGVTRKGGALGRVTGGPAGGSSRPGAAPSVTHEAGVARDRRSCELHRRRPQLRYPDDGDHHDIGGRAGDRPGGRQPSLSEQLNRTGQLAGPVRSFAATPVVGESTQAAYADAEAWLVTQRE